MTKGVGGVTRGSLIHAQQNQTEKKRMIIAKYHLSKRYFSPLSVAPPSHDGQARIPRPGISARVGVARLWFAGVCVGVGVVYDCSGRPSEKRACIKGTSHRARTRSCRKQRHEGMHECFQERLVFVKLMLIVCD